MWTNGLVQIDDNKLMIGKELLDRVKKRIQFRKLSLGSVRLGIYRATYSGRDYSKLKKIPFSKTIEEQMVSAAKFHIPNKPEEEYKDSIKCCITNKCYCWNALFEDLKKGLEFSDKLATKHKLNKEMIEAYLSKCQESESESDSKDDSLSLHDSDSSICSSIHNTACLS